MLWAFAGVTAGAAPPPEPVLAVAAAAGLVIVAGAVVLVRLPGARSRAAAGAAGRTVRA